MSSLNNMKIGRRLGLGFGVILFFLVVLIGVGFYSLALIDEKLERIVQVNNAKIRAASEIDDSLNKITTSISIIAISRDPKARSEMKKNIDEAREKYAKSLEELGKLETNEEGKELIAKLKEEITAGKETNNRAIELGMAGKTSESLSLYEKIALETAPRYLKAIDNIISYQEKRSQLRYEEAKKIYSVTRIVFLALGLIIASISVLLGFLLTLSVTRPVNKGVDFARKMADGDLTQNLDIDQRDEIGVLAGALNEMSSNLRRMFKDISSGVETLASSSTELSAISKQMSMSTEQTSGKANSVAAAAEEMSATTNSYQSLRPWSRPRRMSTRWPVQRSR
jgi:methyl-accepting chemotaxis protein